MHLVIDAIGAKHGGAATELTGILNAALDEQRISRITLFCSPAKDRLFTMPVSERLTQVPKAWTAHNLVLRWLWYSWGLGIECLRIKADLLFVSANFGEACLGLPHVTYVQQSLPFSQEALKCFKSVRDRIRNHIRAWAMKRSCQSAVRIICQSKLMKHWICSAFGLSSSKVAVVYHAPRKLDSGISASRLHERSIFRSEGPRLLYVGTDAPYKKIDTLVQGLSLIRKVMPTAAAVMTLPLDHPLALVPGLYCTGYLNASELAEAYTRSEILVLPSLVETVGIPALEAMSLGTPVLVADRPYAHDICEDAAIFFDPHKPEDFAKKAIRLMNDDELRRNLTSKGLALVERRRAMEPYKQIIQILLDAADGQDRGPS